MRHFKLLGRATALLLVLVLLCNQTAIAQTETTSEIDSSNPYNSEYVRRQAGIYFIGDSGACKVSSDASFAPTAGQNAGYDGKPILTDEQIKEIAANKPVYEQAATAAGIPWQMVAVIHLKEHNLSRSNPSNGQGIYQFFDKRGGPYPTGPVNDAEFLRQTNLAAQFLKSKVNSNLSANRSMSASGAPADTVKDTFFSYNGRSKAYAQQGAQFGFDPNTQPFEGSPYVMNKADRNRDPEINTTTWGQIKTDGGGISYPANRQHGSFVAYGALAGVASTSGGTSCSSNVTGELAQKVVEIARQELQAGANEADNSHTKYGGTAGVAWCGYFVSWVFNEAGKPLEGGPLPAVSSILAYAKEKNIFHAPNESGFVPQPGDVAIYKEGKSPYPSHVNIVVGYDAGANTYTAIGGNEGDSVRMRDHRMSSVALTGFMRVQ